MARRAVSLRQSGSQTKASANRTPASKCPENLPGPVDHDPPLLVPLPPVSQVDGVLDAAGSGRLVIVMSEAVLQDNNRRALR